MSALSEAIEDVEIGFRQLEFAIRLLSYCELGHIKPADFDTDHVVILDGGNLRFPSGHFSNAENIERAANINVVVVFGATVLALDKAFEVARIDADFEAGDDQSKLRTLIYMVRCAYAHGFAEPRWEARGKFARKLSLNIVGAPIDIDLAKLNGTIFNIDQLGGYFSWYRIRDKAIEVLAAKS